MKDLTATTRGVVAALMAAVLTLPAAATAGDGTTSSNSGGGATYSNAPRRRTDFVDGRVRRLAGPRDSHQGQVREPRGPHDRDRAPQVPPHRVGACGLGPRRPRWALRDPLDARLDRAATSSARCPATASSAGAEAEHPRRRSRSSSSTHRDDHLVRARLLRQPHRMRAAADRGHAGRRAQDAPLRDEGRAARERPLDRRAGDRPRARTPAASTTTSQPRQRSISG